jgi:hypothetical protein
MVGVAVTKRIFLAIADAHPDDSEYEISKVEIRHGWGDILHVTIHGDHDTQGHGRAIREAVERALDPQRHSVRLETTA